MASGTRGDRTWIFFGYWCWGMSMLENSRQRARGPSEAAGVILVEWTVATRTGRVGETKQSETDCDGRWKEEGSSAGSNDRWCRGGLTLRMTAGLCRSDLMRTTWTDLFITELNKGEVWRRVVGE